MKLEFDNKIGYQSAVKKLTDDINTARNNKKEGIFQSKIYDTKLPIFVKMLYEMHIEPNGFIEVDKKTIKSGKI